jgi:arginase
VSHVTIFQVPYDSGHRDVRMGRGPLRLVRHGAVERVRQAGHDVVLEPIEVEPAEVPTEPGSTFALLRRLAARVGAAVEEGSIPLVLAGNCISSLGTTAGLGPGTGVLWFDAHGDVNTPDTSPSGFLDGMALACLMGQCWRTLCAGVEGFHPVPAADVVLVGARDLDAEERTLIADWGIKRFAAHDLAGPALAAALDLMAERVSRLYVHLDLDVLDPSVARFNEYAAAGGLHVEQVEQVLDEAAARFDVGGAAFTAYDPGADRDDRALETALHLIETLARRWGQV